MLLRAISSSDSGIRAANAFLDVTSNNIANADTPGFKAARITFQDLLYTGFAAGAPAQGVTPPGSAQIGSGTVVDTITGQFTQGGLIASGRQFDVAIMGEGFFPVTLPDGTMGFTRAGNFVTDNAGQLVTPEGYLLAGGITIPVDATAISISTGGVVNATTPAGTVPIGQINLTRFQNPNGLSRFGDNVFTVTAATGTAVIAAPGTNGLGTTQQGFLEQSNVAIVGELTNLIIAQQAFRFNTQALQVESQVLQTTTELIR